MAGTVGITIDAKFNDEWNDLAKHLVCRNGKVVKTKLDFQNGFTVAPETMIAGGNLEIGFEGMSQDGKIVFPTVWASCGVVKDGANANDDYSADPTNPVWDQLEKQIGDLNKLETSAKDSIVEAVNEVAKKGVKIPVATAETLGGVKAEPATEADTQPVRIGEDGMLFTAPGGGGEKWETIVDYTVPEDCAQVTLTTDVNGNPFSLKRAVALFRFNPTTTVEGIGYVNLNFDASVDGVYGNPGSLHESINIPKNDGEYTFYRVMLEKNNEGITAISRSAVGAQTNNTIVILKVFQGCYENYDPTTLTPFPQGITAISAGCYSVAIGAGTRIKLLGVRE